MHPPLIAVLFEHVDEVTVVLRKPQVPINGILAYASVEVSRDREWLESLRRA